MENKIKIIKPDNQHRSVSMEGIETRLKDYIHKRSRAQVFYGAKFAKLQGTHNSYASSTVTDGREKKMPSVTTCFINLVPKSGKDDRPTPCGSGNTAGRKCLEGQLPGQPTCDPEM